MHTQKERSQFVFKCLTIHILYNLFNLFWSYNIISWCSCFTISLLSFNYFIFRNSSCNCSKILKSTIFMVLTPVRTEVGRMFVLKVHLRKGHCTVSRFFKWCPRWFQKVFSLQISLKSHNSHWNVEFLWIFTIECDLERCDCNAPGVLYTHTQSMWMQGQCAPCPWCRWKCFRRVSWLELVNLQNLHCMKSTAETQETHRTESVLLKALLQ